MIGIFVLAAGVIAFAAVIRHGFSARDEPWAIEAFVARRVRRLSIPSGARDVKNPLPATAEVLAEARAHFADHCSICHANDGSGNTPIGANQYPPAPDMRESWVQSLTDGEIFYVIHNGIRFTGMPAFGSGDMAADQDSWKLVHFIRRLPQISGDELEEMKKMNPKSQNEMAEKEEMEKFLRGEEGKPAAPSQHH